MPSLSENSIILQICLPHIRQALQAAAVWPIFPVSAISLLGIRGKVLSSKDLIPVYPVRFDPAFEGLAQKRRIDAF